LLTGPPGCEWGDELENCVENDCKHPDTRRKCCKFCGDFDARRTVSLNSVTSQMLGDETTSLAYTKAPPLEIIAVCNGDQAVWCKDMGDHECYVSQDICCETCNKKRKSSKDCPYGDHYEWCARMDISECRYRDKRDSCCEKCRGVDVTSTRIPTTEVSTTEYVPSCLKDQASWCPRIGPSDCYASESTCCVTCRKYLRNVKGCHYGDKASWCADYIKSKDHCKTEEMRRRCCYSCGQMMAPTKAPAGLMATARQALGDITKAMFTRLTTILPESTTPEVKTEKPEEHHRTTRPVPDQSESSVTDAPRASTSLKPCSGPNKVAWCSSQSKSTCYANSDICCDLCSRAYTGQEECPYGDRKQNCDVTHCTNQAARRECCATCSDSAEKNRRPPAVPTEPWLPPVSACEGDKVSWCSSLDSSFCYDKRTRENFCCDTCKKFWKEKPGCEYGDRFIWCARMSKERCSDVADDCCETCSKVNL